MEVILKQKDTARVLSDTLLIGTTPVDLTSATVRSLFALNGVTVASSATIVGTPSAGNVSCLIHSTVFASPGKWMQEWEVTYTSTGKQLSGPTLGYNTVIVNPSLNTTA